jgi:predicted nucleic acid-binding protein
VSFVLDNSVALAWCFEDEQTPAIMALLDRVVATGAMAPLLWPLEALDAAKRAELAGLLRALPITLDDETADKSWEDTLRLAERFTLSVYDATYLELAQRRRLPLASMDRALRSAAVALGVEVLLD